MIYKYTYKVNVFQVSEFLHKNGFKIENLIEVISSSKVKTI